jgi:hypothetical protein
VAFDGEGETIWFFPNPIETRSLEISKANRYKPIGDAVQLRVNHRPGVVRLFAIFSIEPISISELQLAAGASRTGEMPKRLDLPHHETLQTYTDLIISE